MNIYQTIFRRNRHTSKNFYLYTMSTKYTTYDVSLTNGLSLIHDKYNKQIKTKNKFELYKHIINNTNSNCIEIADLTPLKGIPLRENTYRFIEKCNNYNETHKKGKKNYVKIDSSKHVEHLLNIGIKNISFSTALYDRYNITDPDVNIAYCNREVNNIYNILKDVSDSELNINIPCSNISTKLNRYIQREIVDSVVENYYSYNARTTLMNDNLTVYELNHILSKITYYAGNDITHMISILLNNIRNLSTTELKHLLQGNENISLHVMCCQFQSLTKDKSLSIPLYENIKQTALFM